MDVSIMKKNEKETEQNFKKLVDSFDKKKKFKNRLFFILNNIFLVS